MQFIPEFETTLRLILADDHPFVREGVRSFLADIPELEIVGEAGSGEEAIQLTRHLKPDLLLLDINLPGMNGLDVIRELRSQKMATKVLVLTVHNTREYVQQVAKAGANGFILKDAPPEEMLQAIRAIQSGQKFYCPSLVEFFVAEETEPKVEQILTQREIEVLVLIAKGMTNKDICERLDITISTAQTYRSRIMEKLNIHNIAGLTRYALQKRLISLE